MYHEYERAASIENASYRLLALNLAITAEKEKFKLLTEGPNVLAVQHLSNKVSELEQHYQETFR